MIRVVAMVLLLAACSKASAFEEAQERYAYLKANGATSAELCREAQKVADAAADERADKLEYQIWRSTSLSHCTRADLHR